MLGGLDAIARYQKATHYPLQESVGAALTRSHRPCKALQCTDPHSLQALPRTRSHGQTGSSRSTARREGRASSLVSRKAMVGLECDMARWKKITNMKFFQIHPPSCSPLEQNSSIIPQGLLKPEPAQGREGFHRPSVRTDTHNSDRTGFLASTQFRYRCDSGHFQL